jgi:hypothetical protein
MEIDDEVTSKWCSQVAQEAPHTKHVKPHQSHCTIKEVHDQTKIVSTILLQYYHIISKFALVDLIE